jgi:hypothetical protein
VPPSLQIQTHTHILLARSPGLPPTHPFVGEPILQLHFQVRWRVRLPPPRVLLPHTYTQDGWFLQPERRPARLPRRTLFSQCICRCSRMCVCLSPPWSSSLTHKHRMDGFCNQNADQLCSLAGLSFPVVYVGAPWSFGFDSQTRGTWENRVPPCVKVPGSSRVPQSPSPPRSLVRDGQPRPHWPLLVNSRSTCPPLSPSPHVNSFIKSTAVINTTLSSIWFPNERN